jgi:hypothetical protein
MDARLLLAAVLAAASVSLAPVTLPAATYKSDNFVVEAATPEIAEQVGQEAERFRRELAIHWVGKALPRWSRPCPIKVTVGANLGAGGATSFMFDHGEVFGWQMNIQGSLERVLDSVLPHEVTHTIFASHFRQPLPRWADEGACTTVEHASERAKQQRMLVQFLQTGRGIAFSQMFAMKDYPQDVMPLYSQGHSLVTFLLYRGGTETFMQFVADGLESERWIEATDKHYSFRSLAQLQNEWLDWVRQGSPKPVGQDPTIILAAAEQPPKARPEPNLIYRGQSVDLGSSRSQPSASAGLVRVAPRADAVAAADSTASAKLRQRLRAAIDKGLHPLRGWRPVAGQAARPEGAAELVESDDPTPDAAPPFAPDTQVAAREGRPASAAGATDRKPRKVILEWTRPDNAAATDDEVFAPDAAAGFDNPERAGRMLR